MPTRRPRRSSSTSWCWSGPRISSRSTASRSIRRARLPRRSATAVIDAAARRVLGRHRSSALPAAHTREHSLEMQLPFLRRLLPDVAHRAAADGLSDARDDRRARRGARAAFCAIGGRCSSPAPICRTTSTRGRRRARRPRCRRASLAFDRRRPARDVRAAIRSTSAGASSRCGGGPAIAVMMAARDARRPRRARAATTRTPGKSPATTTASSGISRRRSAPSADDGRGCALLTDDQQRAALLALARASIDGRVTRTSRGHEPAGRCDVSGGVGRVRDHQAARAAARLPRHAAEPHRACRRSRPLCGRCRPARIRGSRRSTPSELPSSSLEISVLGPLERSTRAPAAFTIGVHGLVAEQGVHRGLLLPQVATEWGWDGRAVPASDLRQGGPAADAVAAAARESSGSRREVFGD